MIGSFPDPQAANPFIFHPSFIETTRRVYKYYGVKPSADLYINKENTLDNMALWCKLDIETYEIEMGP